MNCPNCNSNNVKVKDSRPHRDDAGPYIRRRYECLNCQHRFTTEERHWNKAEPVATSNRPEEPVVTRPEPAQPSMPSEKALRMAREILKKAKAKAYAAN